MHRHSAKLRESRAENHEEQLPETFACSHVVRDPDPYAHLTPAERYTCALQRRDALVSAKRPSFANGRSDRAPTRDR